LHLDLYINKRSRAYITKDAFVLVGVIEPLDSGVAFVTFKSPLAFVPSIPKLFIRILPNPLNESFTVLREIFKDVWRSPEVSSVMSIDAAFRVMRVLLIWTPTGFVFKHIEGESFYLGVVLIQIGLERMKTQKAVRDIVIFYAWKVRSKGYFCFENCGLFAQYSGDQGGPG
jgi:hypothetical protein